MIKSISEKPEKKIEIDLTGPDGNSFVLIGIIRKIAANCNRNTMDSAYRPGDATLIDIDTITKEIRIIGN